MVAQIGQELNQQGGMHKWSGAIQRFLYSQAFADGLRTTAAILTPALLGFYLGNFDIGFAVALGAMCAAFTDSPGPVHHKRNGIVLNIFFCFGVALLTPLAQVHPLLMGLLITATTFFFSLFMVYGARAAAVGSTAILVLILTMDKPVAPHNIVWHAAQVAAGGAFYLLLSLFFYYIQPYRIAQRALAEAIFETADYLKVRSGFYNSSLPLESVYKDLMAQHVVVNEKQDGVREIFFKTKNIAEERTAEARRLVYLFVQLVDLFEEISASFHQYSHLRKQYESTGILPQYHQTINKIADELEGIGLAVGSGKKFESGFNYGDEVRKLKAAVDALQLEKETDRLLLKRIVVNVRALFTGLQKMAVYFDESASIPASRHDHSPFVSHQVVQWRTLWENLNLKSAVFRHAARVALACVLGYAISRWLDYGQYSYWILLTIAFILKPAFSLTRQRNVERIAGTVAGGIMGTLILLITQNTTVLFVLMVLFMIGAFSAMRISYLTMVILITPYVLILFNFLGSGFADVFRERIFDTVLGCAIAFIVSYFFLPKWESETITENMVAVLEANAKYLQILSIALAGGPWGRLDYKLARRKVYVESANLAAAFQRMLSEPASKQKSKKEVQRFVVLTGLLYSNAAAVFRQFLEHPTQAVSGVEVVQQAQTNLERSVHLLQEAATDTSVSPRMAKAAATASDPLLLQQLNFINNLSQRIAVLAKEINGQSATELPTHSPAVPAL